MSRTIDEIMVCYTQRKERLDPLHKAALEVRQAYYGDITLPLPEIDRSEKPLVANLLWSTGEQKSMRVASTMPNIYYPSMSPGQKTYDARARDRRNVNLAWWDLDRQKLKLRKRARHLVYYAHSPVMLHPHFGTRNTPPRPSWQVRNPLATLAPEIEVGEVCPPDIIFTYPKSFAWLTQKYPGAAAKFGLERDVQDGTVVILEYQDEDDNVLAVVGSRVERRATTYFNDLPPVRAEMILELERTPNIVGRCTAVVAGGIGLEHPRGSFDGTIGMWQAMGKLMALEVIGMQRSIWPEEWLISDPTSDGVKVLTPADPLHGVMGVIEGGKLQPVTPNINQAGQQMIDRLERSVRIESSTPAELGGESTSNIRTGRRGDQILSSVLDFPLQEFQEILAVSLQEEDKIAIAIDKAYFPQSKSYFISSTAGEITYEASKLWDSDTHFVFYSHAGVDAQGIVVELGQLVGTGLISKRSAMETHPLIEDPQGEFDRMTAERLDDGLLNGLAQMAQDPNLAPVVAQVAQNLQLGDMAVPDAVLKVHEAMQVMQAQMQAQQQAQMGAGPPGAGAPGGAPPGGPGPEAAQPGMGQPQPAIAAPPQGLTNLTQLLRQLHTGAAVGPVPNALGIAS